jgi:hypothetical protein
MGNDYFILDFSNSEVHPIEGFIFVVRKSTASHPIRRITEQRNLHYILIKMWNFWVSVD